MSAPLPIGAPINVPANSNLTQNLGCLPDMNDAIRSTWQILVFDVITKAIDGAGVLTETTTSVQFYGSVNVYTPTPTDIAQHGERAWSMKDCTADVTVKLKNDDVVIYLGTQYRVQSYSDYTPYGFQAFQLILDYEGAGPVTS